MTNFRSLRVIALVVTLLIVSVMPIMADGCIPGPGCGATEQPVIIIFD